MSYNYSDNPDIAMTLEASPQLKQHLLQLIDREQKLMQTKLLQEAEKVERIKKIEDDFVKWAEEKTKKYHTQIEKAQKNKEEHISKIVKKCKDRSKFVVKKYENQKNLYRKSMKEAWKKAEKFNQDIIAYQESKNHIGKFQGAKTPQANSVQIDFERNLVDSHLERRKDHSMSYLKNTSTFQNNYSSNIFGITQFQQIPESKEQDYHENTMNLLEAIGRLKQIEKNKQTVKIQQMGEKMEKIEKSRARRQQKMKKSMNKTTIQKDNYDYEPQVQKKKPETKNKRVHSETFYKPDCRAKDYSIDAKHKREEMFEEHLHSGNSYLQNLKVRHLKTMLAKNIAFNAMEKKLFLQRLH